ncbi:MAG: peptidylprolyl isomerase [Planctomycetota bacterium]|nr:peptidylprolyl isomerase [Planctomycetota bacterium]
MPGPVHLFQCITCTSLLLAATSLNTGCSSSNSTRVPTTTSNQDQERTWPSDAGQARRPRSSSKPIALIEQESITIETLQDRLIEQAGAEILRELRLESSLRSALEEASIQIDDMATKNEENLLLERLSDDENTARKLLEELRNNEGLGPSRFKALLWRNAALRALVQDDIELSEPLLRRMHRLEHGQRFIIRLIVLSTLQESEEVRLDLNDGVDFSTMAARRSIDASRDRGGLLEPISLEDPAWPQGIRTALAELQPGDISPVIFMDDRFAIARVEEIIPEDGSSFESNRPELVRIARLAQERMKMAELAGKLGPRPKLRVLDPTLRNAWEIDESAR